MELVDTIAIKRTAEALIDICKEVCVELNVERTTCIHNIHACARARTHI
jgi:hypothetical protein